MTTNIYLARLLAQEREQDFRNHADARRRLKAAQAPQEARPSFLHRLFHRDRDELESGRWQAA